MSRRIYKRIVGATECPVKVAWHKPVGEKTEFIAVTVPDMLDYKGERYPFVMRGYVDPDSAEWDDDTAFSGPAWVEKAYTLARYTWATMYETQGPEHYNTKRMRGVWAMFARHMKGDPQLKDCTDDIFPDSPRPVGVIPIATHDKRG